MLAAGAWVTPNVRLERPIGAGGMGAVWLAEHTTLRTKVVVKLMRPELAHDPETLSRFSREAAAAANVKSPHVVQVLDHGVAPDGSPFITMELLEGEDLGARLKRGPIAPDEAAVIISQTCKALARAHERGIVHRDVKPQNIFLCSTFGETFVKVLDFGIAKAGGDLQSGLDTTNTGAVMGTPYYMSPEQALGHSTLDFRSDLWAVGVVAFEMLTGRKPFLGETVGALAVAICTKPLPRPSSVSGALGRAVDAWFERACAREPGARFASAKDLADGFSAAMSGPTSLGLAHTVPSVPPAAIPLLSSTTSAPTSHAPSARPAPPSSLPIAAILAASFGAICIILAAALVIRATTKTVRPETNVVASAPPSTHVDPYAPRPTEPTPSASVDVVSIDSLPRTASSAARPLRPTTTTAPHTTSTRPASSFDRNSID